MKWHFWVIQGVLFLLLMFFLIFPQEVIYGQNLSPDEEYQSIIEKVKKGEDEGVDYIKLRMLYTQTSWYQPESKERDENILKMTQAWIDKRYDEAIQIGNQLLETEYLNPFIHDLFTKIYKETGRGDAFFHMLMFIKIITSIKGDGKNYETAYEVISTWEEKAMMTFVLVSAVEQVINPILHDGHHYHMIKVKSDETGEESALYFNIDIPYQKAQQAGPVMTPPVVTSVPSPTPSFQHITTYTDPTGQFSVTFPAGFSLIASQSNLIQCATPNNGMLYIVISDYANTMKAFSDEVMKRPGTFSGESQFQAGNVSGKIQLYTMSGSFQVLDGKNYAVLFVTYSGIEFGLVVVLPVESYSAAQGWLSTLITGVQYRSVIPSPSTSTLTLPISTPQEFVAPDGSFRVSLPSGNSKGGEWPNIFEFKTPSQGTLYILIGDAAATLNLFYQDLAKKQGIPQGQPVLFDARGVPGKMEIYTMVGSFQESDGKNYVSFLVTYDKSGCSLVIVVPREFYTDAQSWIAPLITGVTFTTATPPLTPTLTPTPLPTETLPPLMGG